MQSTEKTPTITLSLNDAKRIARASHCSATDPERYQLTGVYVGPLLGHGDRLYACATDGKRLVAIRLDACRTPTVELADFQGMIFGPDVTAVLRSLYGKRKARGSGSNRKNKYELKRGVTDPLVDILRPENGADVIRVRFSRDGAASVQTFAPVEAAFPKIEDVLPKRDVVLGRRPDNVTLDTAYISDVWHVLGVGEDPSIGNYAFAPATDAWKNGPAWVTSDDAIYGAMPLYLENDTSFSERAAKAVRGWLQRERDEMDSPAATGGAS